MLQMYKNRTKCKVRNAFSSSLLKNNYSLMTTMLLAVDKKTSEIAITALPDNF